MINGATLLERISQTSRVLSEDILVDGFAEGKISVIMPAYNEASCIGASVSDVKRQFETACQDFEIIVVDDGSLDGTGKVARHFSEERVRVIGYDRNQGKGYALKEGFLHARGEITFLVDSDSEIHARDLRAYVQALDLADIVIGSKRHPLSAVHTPPIRRFLSLGYNILERLLTGVRASDTQAGFKAAKSAVLYKVLPLLSVKRYAFDAEFLAVASLLNFRIKELPVEVELTATFSARQVFRMLIDLLGICYRLRISRWYQRNMAVLEDSYRPIIRW
jgi:glycosyltransferase involved in cell wall biosynthesis